MQNDTLKLLIAFKFANFCSFSIGGNLDFINILPKSFKVGGGDQLAQANCQTPFGYFLTQHGTTWPWANTFCCSSTKELHGWCGSWQTIPSKSF